MIHNVIRRVEGGGTRMPVLRHLKDYRSITVHRGRKEGEETKTRLYQLKRSVWECPLLYLSNVSRFRTTLSVLPARIRFMGKELDLPRHLERRITGG